MAQCGKKTKRCRKCGHKYPAAEYELDACPDCGEDRACKRPAMTNGACYLHGGKSLKGLAHPGYKSGRWSKYMPARMVPRYEESKNDTELLAVRADIALVDARIADLLVRVDTGESTHIWKKLVGFRNDALDAQRIGDDRKRALSLEGIFRTIGQGAADYAAWHDVIGLIEQRRKLVESERKRLIEMQQMVTVEESMLLVNAAAHSFKTRLAEKCDPDIARAVMMAVAEDLARIYTMPLPA